MYLAFVIVGVVFIMLIGALLAGQLSVLGLFLSALVIGLLLFVLSRKMRSGIRTGMVADLVFGGSAMTDMEYLQAQIADYDKQIASLKRAGKA